MNEDEKLPAGSASCDPMQQRARELAAGALFCALGVTVPILFHVFGVGRVFLPMHLPVLFGGLVLSAPMASLVGFLTPWASMVLTGMPPLPMAIIMCVELAVLGGAASLALRMRMPVWAAAWIAIAARAVATFVLTLALARVLHLPPNATGLASVAAGLPGIALQAIVIPVAAYPLIARRRT